MTQNNLDSAQNCVDVFSTNMNKMFVNCGLYSNQNKCKYNNISFLLSSMTFLAAKGAAQ